ncbi:hypothetical protein [Gordonia jinghuaiqii]|uniref:hypothetical protein n=1 Tax=Gordonia jinghuaiqii TaxID=2758710 RepID=UPI001FD598A2|nr:hypothetical protein [Gordonia jinghuaiqii]
MEGAAATPATVVVIGQPGSVRTMLCRRLHRLGATIEVVDDTEPDRRYSFDGSELRPVHADDCRSSRVVSCVAVLGPPPGGPRGCWNWRRRRAARRQEDRVISALLTDTSRADSCRLLIVAEAFAAADVRKARRRAREVAREAAYETEINGTSVTSTFYLVVGASLSTTAAMPAIVRWAYGGPPRARISVDR